MLDQETIEQIEVLRALPTPIKKIAKQLGLSPATVHKYCKHMNVDCSPKPKPKPDRVVRRAANGDIVRSRGRCLGYIRLCLLDGTVINEHRYVMECLLGRKLLPWEHVHHKDGDRSNNSPNNLEVLTARDHGKAHNPKKPLVSLTCPCCGATFTRTQSYVAYAKRHNQNMHCSRSCSAKMQHKPT